MIVFVLYPRQDVIASSRTSCPLSKTAVPVFQPDRQMKHQIPAEGQPSRSIKNMRLKQFLTALGRLRKDLLNFHFRSDKSRVKKRSYFSCFYSSRHAQYQLTFLMDATSHYFVTMKHYHANTNLAFENMRRINVLTQLSN